MPPLVSILIPAYNAELYLRECLESACAQTYANCEVIMVDDGSTDSTYKLALRFESKMCRMVRQENRGQAGALNTGMLLAQGEYIQFLDADDVLHPEKVAAQVDRLQPADPSAVATGAWSRFGSNIVDAQFTPEPIWRDLSPTEWLIESWMGGGMMHVAAWLIPHDVAERAGRWNETLTMAANLDADFLLGQFSLLPDAFSALMRRVTTDPAIFR